MISLIKLFHLKWSCGEIEKYILVWSTPFADSTRMQHSHYSVRLVRLLFVLFNSPQFSSGRNQNQRLRNALMKQSLRCTGYFSSLFPIDTRPMPIFTTMGISWEQFVNTLVQMFRGRIDEHALPSLWTALPVVLVATIILKESSSQDLHIMPNSSIYYSQMSS